MLCSFSSNLSHTNASPVYTQTHMHLYTEKAQSRTRRWQASPFIKTGGMLWIQAVNITLFATRCLHPACNKQIKAIFSLRQVLKAVTWTLKHTRARAHRRLLKHHARYTAKSILCPKPLAHTNTHTRHISAEGYEEFEQCTPTASRCHCHSNVHRLLIYWPLRNNVTSFKSIDSPHLIKHWIIVSSGCVQQHRAVWSQNAP